MHLKFIYCTTKFFSSLTPCIHWLGSPSCCVRQVHRRGGSSKKCSMGSAVSDALSAAAPFVAGGMLCSDAGGVGKLGCGDGYVGWLVSEVGWDWLVCYGGDCKVGWCELVIWFGKKFEWSWIEKGWGLELGLGSKGLCLIWLIHLRGEAWNPERGCCISSSSTTDKESFLVQGLGWNKTKVLVNILWKRGVWWLELGSLWLPLGGDIVTRHIQSNAHLQGLRLCLEMRLIPLHPLWPQPKRWSQALQLASQFNEKIPATSINTMARTKTYQNCEKKDSSKFK